MSDITIKHYDGSNTTMYDTALWAAMWWTDKLRSGLPGAGSGSTELMMAMALLDEVLPIPKDIDESKLCYFETSLSVEFNDVLNEKGYLDLYRDYDTPKIIADCMDKAGIPFVMDRKFPCKTGMRISRTNIMLKDGYGAQYQQVFP